MPVSDPELATFFVPSYPPGRQYQSQLGFSSTFALRHLVLVVRGWDQTDEDPSYHGLGDPNGEIPESLLPIWPSSAEPVFWPPSHELSAEDIGRITGTPPPWVE